MDYDWQGFLLLFIALTAFIAFVLLIAGGIVLVQRMRDRRKQHQ